MLGRFELEVGDAGEDITEVDNELVVDGLDWLELSIDLDLQTWVAQSRENRDKAWVAMLHSRQLEVILTELTAIDDTGRSWQDMDGSVSWEWVILEPVMEEVSILVEAERQVVRYLINNSWE